MIQVVQRKILSHFLKRKSLPPSSPLESDAKIAAFKEQPGTQIIAYLNSDHLKVWLEVGKSPEMEEFFLGHVTDSSLFGKHTAPSIIIYRDDAEPIQYSGDFFKPDIISWASSEGYPLVVELAQNVWVRSTKSKMPLVAFFNSEASTPEISAIPNDVAPKYKGRVLMTSSTLTQIAERWGASGKKLPTAVFVKWLPEEENPKFFVFDEDGEKLTATTFDSFIEKSLSGEYKSFRKSDPIPETNDGPVKILVGKNFDQIVYDNTKDVFVEFYAPWCGHCKKLEPVWESLGKSIKDPSVVIAKMDATSNTPPPELLITGFPTLILFPKDNKSGVRYEGERDLNALKKYVEDHALASAKRDEL